MASANERLRDALLAGSLTVLDVACSLGVDRKTVERWITQGRVPYPRHRRHVATMVGQSEAYLWPDALTRSQLEAVTDSEVVRVYPHRASVPSELWHRLLVGAEHCVDVLVYSGMWLPDQNPRLAKLLAQKAAVGATVRVLLGDPESAEVARRGLEEGIGDAMAGKIRNVLVHYRELAGSADVQVRLHSTTLYNSLYRFDDQLLVNAHVYGYPAAHAPVLHLRRLRSGVLFETYTDSFANVWAGARPAWPTEEA